MFDYFEDDDNFYLVLESPEKSMDLFDFIVERDSLPESVARGIFAQLLEAVEYCFSKGVVHRDIKGENIVLDMNKKEIKLIDFGCSRFLHEFQHNLWEGKNK